MQNPSNCLHQAMFIASESYSGSAYQTALFEEMDDLCSDAFVPSYETDASNVPAMAA